MLIAVEFAHGAAQDLELAVAHGSKFFVHWELALVRLYVSADAVADHLLRH